MNELIIRDVVISIEDGLYRLNDLHKAAGAENKHKPSLWLELEQTKSYIDFLDEKRDAVITASKQNQIVMIVKNGGSKKQGTYVCKNLVYKYAMWISHEFEFHVINAFDSLVNDAAQYDLALTQWKKAMLLEKPCEWQKLYTEDFYKPVMRLFGWKFESNKGGLPSVIGLITRNWIYDVVVPHEILVEIDEKRESEKIHQWFNDLGGREKLRHQIAMVSGIAKTCRTYGEFKIKAGCVFNDTPLQIEML
jgi:hypothetical protein